MGYFENNAFRKVEVDHLNSMILDETGTPNISTPYGERITHSSATSKILDYTLKGYDSDIEAVRMGRRFYDPVPKRFLTPDTYILERPEKCVERLVECNLYSYAADNPISFTDPSGQSATALIGLTGLVIGGTGAAAYGVGRGALWLANSLGAMSDATYNNQVHRLNDGAARAWNSVYKPIVENTMGAYRASLAIIKGAANAYTGRDLLHASSFDGLTFGQKNLNSAQRLMEATFPLKDAGIGMMARGMNMGGAFGLEAYNFSINHIMSGSAERLNNYDDGFRFYDTQPSSGSYQFDVSF